MIKKNILKGGFLEIPTFQGCECPIFHQKFDFTTPLKSDFIPLLAVELFIFKVKIFTPFGWFC